MNENARVYGFEPYAPQEIINDGFGLGGSSPDGGTIEVNSAYIMRDGKPYIDVMGEFHYVRCPREAWRRELCKMRDGGVRTVAAYVFWIYHEETEGEFCFEGRRDLRAFVLEAADVGLDVMIRIGPWAHGECRNGGFPDWLLKKGCRTRSNDPEYLSLVRRFYEKIAEQTAGLYYSDGGPITGVQLENELVSNATHIDELRRIAIEVGINAPIYTATGWNSRYGARIPESGVLPVFGAYPEAPWSNSRDKLPPPQCYAFSRNRNDSAIGVDIMKDTDKDGWRLPYERYPFATCELGGGIQVTHHRRPIISPMDVYALSLTKLGCGNNLIGYYMYHGGTNMIGKTTLQESRATGYPNDYPILNYDFQAPISEYGECREHYGLLNMLHMFARDFGDILAPMSAVLPVWPAAPDDLCSLRYAMRTDGESGFVFVNHHVHAYELADHTSVVINALGAAFPPIDVKGSCAFFMPVKMKLGRHELKYAVCQPICREGSAYFFSAIDGISPEYCVDGEIIRAGGGRSVISLGDVRIVTLPPDEAVYLRRVGGAVRIGRGCNIYECGGRIECAEGGEFEYDTWNGTGFDTERAGVPEENADIAIYKLPSPPIAPSHPEELAIGGERRIDWYRVEVTSDRGIVQIGLCGDVLQLYADGELAADLYYYGKPWRLPASLLYGRECYIAVSEMRDDFYREF